jgi:hypothetical protein
MHQPHSTTAAALAPPDVPAAARQSLVLAGCPEAYHRAPLQFNSAVPAVMEAVHTAGWSCRVRACL